MERIPALSIRQPWAELIVRGRKSIEVRSWYSEYRGPLWVHAGSKVAPEFERGLDLSNLFRGGYVGSVVVDAVIPLDRHRWETWATKHLCSVSDYVPGLYGWVLSLPHRFEQPIQGPGQLSLFYPTVELNELLHAANSTNREVELAARS